MLLPEEQTIYRTEYIMGKKVGYIILSLALLCSAKALDLELEISLSSNHAAKKAASILSQTFNFFGYS